MFPCCKTFQKLYKLENILTLQQGLISKKNYLSLFDQETFIQLRFKILFITKKC